MRRVWIAAIAAVLLLSSVVAVTSVGASEGTARESAASSSLSPYFGATFSATHLPHTFGQAPSWTTGGEVLSTALDAAGITQIYRSELDGGRQECLTCATVTGPNALPQERRQGDWIMFESYGEQPTHIGGPGLGGFGGDLYVMRPDGTHVYRLTTNSDPDDGAPFGATTGTPYDNFHAFWSPDGDHVIWTHTEADPLSQGGERWEIMLGDFTTHGGVPSLTDVQVVGPPFGAYETQPWSPDGKGFLFFAAGGYRSPFQSAPPGWGNARLYYMRIFGRGATPAHPLVTPISDNEPMYEEQAVFTPDMRDVIMMSNRGDTLGSWYGEVAAAAQRTAFDAPETGATQTLQFLADFSGADFESDLYIVDGNSGAIRRLTEFHEVIPEFFWNQGETKILTTLTQNGAHGGPHASYTFQFGGIDSTDRAIPKATPAWLFGKPIDMARVAAQAQTPTQSGPELNRSVSVAPPARPAAGFPHAATKSGSSAIPSVVATYLTVWESDLTALGNEANESFAAPNLLARLLTLT